MTEMSTRPSEIADADLVRSNGCGEEIMATFKFHRPPARTVDSFDLVGAKATNLKGPNLMISRG